ncbi:MAG: glycosyl hydrolase 115 family protein [Muribaculaceae bacterium]|nr:glycosyl hydrolase 115 family protein [Muribaculaceae bacterium]
MTLPRTLLTALALAVSLLAGAAEIIWFDGKQPVTYSLPPGADPVVTTAAGMFAGDMLAVTGKSAECAPPEQARIRLIQLDTADDAEIKSARNAGIDTGKLKSLTDGFAIKVKDGIIYVAGANGRGTAYGLLELSRKAGVSPWIWWGDVIPEKKKALTIDSGYETMQGASVDRRGIFINDEDWSLRPWSHLNFEPSDKTKIGPKTYRKIFELLLRLRANTLWPAMHEGTTAFFRLPGAKEQADSCGIIIGTSHCEPLLRNNVGEWDSKTRGRFNYLTNRDEVKEYWAERLAEVKDSKGGNMLTIGMRGIHDSSMEGYKTTQEKFDGLQEVIIDQQRLIAENLGDPSQQDQVFVPYKEVLELYEQGLEVPDYVTLMWCDDNHGYLTRLSTKEERKRKGGAGVYYHLSYWGQPHDYLWLTTTQPGLIYHQMRRAFDRGAKKIWIANVHDPKVAGYDLELFLDMAWNIDGVSGSTLRDHYHAWLTRNFGAAAADRVLGAMLDFYRLCGQRRPEFMGWSEVEKDRRLYERRLTPVRSSEFNPNEFGDELQRYVYEYDRIATLVDAVTRYVDPSLHDAWYAAVVYPVCAASAHARSLLEAQKARALASGRNAILDREATEEKIAAHCAASQLAYQEVRKLTDYYNYVVADGKWAGLMDMRPRDLPVFYAPNLPVILTDKELIRYIDSPIAKPDSINAGNTLARDAADFDNATGSVQAIGMLGHSMKAVDMSKGSSLKYTFETAEDTSGVMRVAVIPTHPLDGGDLRFGVSIDGSEPEIFNIREPFRSEQWKQNVMRGQTVRTVPATLSAGAHTLEIIALDDNLVVDQWMWDDKPDRQFYIFPTRDAR